MSGVILFCFLLLPFIGLAQEQKDTLKVVGVEQQAGLSEEDILDLQKPIRPSGGGLSAAAIEPSANLAKDLPLRPELDPQPMLMYWYRFPILQRGDYLPRWETGYMYGTNGRYGDRLNGYSAYSQMGISQTMGEYWTLDASMSLQKTLFYNSASFNTSLNWHPSKHFELTAFASYMPGSFFSQMQSIPAFHWGGFATFQSDTEVPFGIDLGASDYYDAMSGHQVVPIVQPFIKVGASKIGIDFGPMIYDAINKSNHRGGFGGGMNPIPQPIKAIPRVAPRR